MANDPFHHGEPPRPAAQRRREPGPGAVQSGRAARHAATPATKHKPAIRRDSNGLQNGKTSEVGCILLEIIYIIYYIHMVIHLSSSIEDV